MILCEVPSQAICKSSGQLVVRPRGLSFSLFLTLWETFESSVSPLCFKTQAYSGNSDERVINVLIYGLSFALLRYYEGTHFMMKPLWNWRNVLAGASQWEFVKTDEAAVWQSLD